MIGRNVVLFKSNFREDYVLSTNNIAVLLVEHVVQSIKPRGFEWVEGLDGIRDFIISKGGVKGIVHFLRGLFPYN